MNYPAHNSVFSGLIDKLEEFDPYELSEDTVNQIISNFDLFITDILLRTHSLTSTGQSEKILALMFSFTSIVNMIAAKSHKVLNSLSKWVIKIKAALYAIAQNMGSNSISISTNIPFGFSISLSWAVP